jgi:uncharacterized phage infection (PIP) family protein YhgE
MKKCQPWAVAAVYLMQSVSGKEHYTKIVDYIFETDLTELAEKGVKTSHTITERLNQKVIDGRAVFDNNGNGYYSLNDEDTARNYEEIQGVVQCLKDNNQEVKLRTHKSKEKKATEEEPVVVEENDTLTTEARKLSEESRRLSDEARKLSDETLRLSDETIRLTDENKELRVVNQQLREENQQLIEKLESIKQLC